MISQKILILGTTASGKSRLAFQLAKELDGEILVVDSMKVYRKMDIGTAKPSKEQQSQINYHLIDVVEPNQEFSVAKFLELADDAIKKIQTKNKPVIAVGGTALYIKALLFGLFKGPGTDKQIRKKLKKQAKEVGLEEMYKHLQTVDPVACQKIHQNDAKRIIRALEVFELTGKPISSFQKQFDKNPKTDWTIIGLRREKELESRRINARVKKMIEAGLVDEVKKLLAETNLSRQAECAIGYAEIIEFLKGELALEDTIENIKKNSRRLAKHQRTWFKRFSDVNWVDIKENDTPEEILKRAKKIIEERNK